MCVVCACVYAGKREASLLTATTPLLCDTGTDPRIKEWATKLLQDLSLCSSDATRAGNFAACAVACQVLTNANAVLIGGAKVLNEEWAAKRAEYTASIKPVGDQQAAADLFFETLDHAAEEIKKCHTLVSQASTACSLVAAGLQAQIDHQDLDFRYALAL